MIEQKNQCSSVRKMVLEATQAAPQIEVPHQREKISEKKEVSASRDDTGKV